MKKLSDEEKAYLATQMDRAQTGIRNARLGLRETALHSRIARIASIAILSLGALWLIIALSKIEDFKISRLQRSFSHSEIKEAKWDGRIIRKYIYETGGTYEGDSPSKTYYRVVLKASPSYPGCNTAYGERQYDVSYKVWQRVKVGDYIAVKGKKVGWSQSIALALASVGRFDDALLFLDKAIEANPKNDWALRDKGLVLKKMGRYEEAKQYLKE